MAAKRKSKAHVDAAKRGAVTKKKNEAAAAKLFAKRSAAAKKGAIERKKRENEAKQKQRNRKTRQTKIRNAERARVAAMLPQVSERYMRFFDTLVSTNIPTDKAASYAVRLASINQLPGKSYQRKVLFYDLVDELYDDYAYDFDDYREDGDRDS